MTSAKIENGGVTRPDLAVDSVGSAQLANGAVLGSDLAAGSVDYSKIADGTVGRAELANNSVDGSKVVDGSVSLADLATNAKAGKTVAGSWSRYSGSTTTAPIGTTPTSIGSLSTDGGGPLAVGQASLLVVSGQVRVLPATAAAASLNCSVYVNGANPLPTANVQLAAGTSTSVPISGLLPVAAGSYDVSVSCVGTNVLVQFVRVAALAVGS